MRTSANKRETAHMHNNVFDYFFEIKGDQESNNSLLLTIVDTHDDILLPTFL